MGDLVGSFGQDGVGDGDARLAEQVVLALITLGGVLLFEGCGYLAVVAFNRGKGRVGEAFGIFSPRSLAELEDQATRLPQINEQFKSYSNAWKSTLGSLTEANLTRFWESCSTIAWIGTA